MAGIWAWPFAWLRSAAQTSDLGPMGGLALEALPGGAWSRQVATAHQKAAVVAAAEELFGIRRQNREPWLVLIRLDVP